MNFELTVLGTNAAMPSLSRRPSAQVLEVNFQPYLIDCGEATQLALMAHVPRYNRIKQIFITHLHGDHVFGLPGLLSSWQLFDRNRPLDLFGPAGLQALVETPLAQSLSQLHFPVRYHVLDPGVHQLIHSDDQVEVFSLPLEHRIPTCGYLFRERRRLPNMLPEKIEEFDIPHTAIPAIKAGGDYVCPDGRVIPHEELTLAPPPARSFAYCSDTRYLPRLAPLLRGIDLLYHESTFLEKDAQRAEETFHSTARQAGLLAGEAGAKRLLLGHYSSRYDDPEAFAAEAREVFPEVIAGREGMKIAL